MAPGDESTAKKLKVEDGEWVFSEFRKNDGLKQSVKKEMDKFSFPNISLCLLQIVGCDADESISFSKAYCQTRRCTNDSDKDKRQIFSLKSVFQYGMKILNTYLDDESYLPTDAGARLALKKFVSFVLSREETEKHLKSAQRRNFTESEWCAIIAHHYLSKLAVCSHYILDSHYSPKTSLCPCGCHEKIEGQYGNTSIGHLDAWHGNLDILMGQVIPVAVPDGNGEKNDAEIELEECSFKTTGRNQLIAQTIVFAFLQMQHHPEFDHFLIPALGISNADLNCFMYDVKHDILLECFPQRLFGDDLKLSTVLVTWLILNYQFLCSGVTEEMLELNYKSNFQKLAGEKLDIYQHKLHYDCSLPQAFDEEPWYQLSEVQFKVEGKPAEQRGSRMEKLLSGIPL